MKKAADLYLSDKLAPHAPALVRKPETRTEVKVDPKVYDAYVGDYQTPEGPVVTFSVENGHLMMKEGRREGRHVTRDPQSGLAFRLWPGLPSKEALSIST